MISQGEGSTHTFEAHRDLEPDYDAGTYQARTRR